MRESDDTEIFAVISPTVEEKLLSGTASIVRDEQGAPPQEETIE